MICFTLRPAKSASAINLDTLFYEDLPADCFTRTGVALALSRPQLQFDARHQSVRQEREAARLRSCVCSSGARVREGLGRPVIIFGAYPKPDTYASYLWDTTLADTTKSLP